MTDMFISVVYLTENMTTFWKENLLCIATKVNNLLFIHFSVPVPIISIKEPLVPALFPFSLEMMLLSLISK